MLKNYIKITIRSLLKNKAFSFINIFGLAIGMTVCLIILKYVIYEKSYDNFHESKEQLFRLTEYNIAEDGRITNKAATTSPGYGPAMKSYFPEIADYCRVVHTSPFMSTPVLAVGENRFSEEKLYYTDNSFFEMFSYPLAKGSSKQALKEPNSIVLSEELAQKYFRDQDPMNQPVLFNMGSRGTKLLTVKGIMKDFPHNTHLKADALISFNTLPANWNLDEQLDWGNFYVYTRLFPGVHAERVTSKMSAFLKHLIGDYANHYQLHLQPVQDIHLYSHMRYEIEENGSGRLVNFLIIVGFSILIVAWLNYINLSMAKSIERMKEMAIRKVMGSLGKQIINQLLLEALLINFMALALAMSLMQILLPLFQSLTGNPLDFSFTQNPGYLGLILLVVFTGTIISGLYPAVLLSTLKPATALKNKKVTKIGGLNLKKVLIIFQFVVSTVMVAGSLIIYSQMSHMRNKDLGMNIDQVLVIKGPGIKDSTYASKMEFFKNKVKSDLQVSNVSVSSSIPGTELVWGRSLSKPGASDDALVPTSVIATDYNFTSVFEVSLLAGRFFSKAFVTDHEAVVLNEKAIQELGFKSAPEAIDQTIVWYENGGPLRKKIIGVVANFDQQSPKRSHQPIVFALELWAPWADEYYALKVNGESIGKTMNGLNEIWQQVFPDSPYDYFFLDEFFNRQYAADQRFGWIFGVFTILGVIIACLGLFGLSMLTISQRIKEVGIRKVLGASISNITLLFSKDLIKLVLLGIAVALPLTWYVATEWLSHFSSRIMLKWWLFVVPVAIVILLSLLTIGTQTIKAALGNPAEALRNE
ncbi:ABC transporter permease [Fulvivirgaceae bacterium BMA10]|uniref:ABC transporter permease n=1 Tax=Splendidivirga corallicola TaxID=3051826 RepID=A0ABT8KYQ8_9BACT|nr:ABC transporter permease [Fulvivirgaceae bacterium BMA10]